MVTATRWLRAKVTRMRTAASLNFSLLSSDSLPVLVELTDAHDVLAIEDLAGALNVVAIVAVDAHQGTALLELVGQLPRFAVIDGGHSPKHAAHSTANDRSAHR